MIRIRLARDGAKNNPFYHIVADEKRSKRDGKHLEILGFWHPSSKELKVSKEKIQAWVKKGAVVTDAVEKLLK